MSNNKQSMKLYTEEQIFKYLLENGTIDLDSFILDITPIELPSDSLCINCDDSKSTHNICMDCIIKIGKENIELPSDEEIETYINSIDKYHIIKDFYCDGFQDGAKWMRDKIQGGKQ